MQAQSIPTPRRTRERQRILILGAGMAGLCAAYELRKLGHDPMILEAQNRAGGRVQTLRDPFADGLHAEAGAIRIPDNHLFTMGYVNEFSLPLEPAFAPGKADLRLIFDKEKPRSADELAISDAALPAKYIREIVEASGALDDVTAVPKNMVELDAMTFPQFLRSRGASEGAIQRILLGFPLDTQSSVWSLVEEVHLARTKTLSRIVGGNDRLPKAIAQSLGSIVRYGCKVLAIRQDEMGVTATYTKNGVRFTKRGDRMICTIPFSVLRSVDTQLSPSKKTAIERQNYTSVSRVYVQTRSRFWLAKGLTGLAYTDLPAQRIYPASIGNGAGRGILHTYTWGDEAKLIDSMQTAERHKRALEQMTRVFPELAQEAEGGAFKSWTLDPYARGAFTEYAPRESAGAAIRNRTPEGRIHFAGEHCTVISGWMQSAVASAFAAVAEVA